MTEREKLMDLIINAKRTDPETGSFAEWLADFLLGYGVVVPMDDDPSADRLRELIRADREGRCFVLLVAPDPYAGEEQVVVCEDGEATPWNVIEVAICPGGNGQMNCFYKTDGPTFQTADIGVTVFFPDETEKIEAALKKMQEEEREENQYEVL